MNIVANTSTAPGDGQIADQVATNRLGSIALVRAALPDLRAQGGGRVMQVSSEGGQYAYLCFSVYHATTWGIEGFVESVVKEVGGFGIELTLVEVGPTGTGFAAALVRAEPMEVYADTPAGGAPPRPRRRLLGAARRRRTDGGRDDHVHGLGACPAATDPRQRRLRVDPRGARGARGRA